MVRAPRECDWKVEEPKPVNAHCQVISPWRLWADRIPLSSVYAAKKEDWKFG